METSQPNDVINNKVADLEQNGNSSLKNKSDKQTKAARAVAAQVIKENF